ncbi:MAG: tetratricopeptide repeat protein [Nibricoccus sp.]
MTSSNPGPDRSLPERKTGKMLRWFLILLLAVLALAYAGTVSSPFIFDDEPAIVENKTIISLARPGVVLSTAPGTTVEGRPVGNLSLAVNYAIGGLKVRSYHVFNFLIHTGSALLLFGIVRRTLTKDIRFKENAGWLALLVAAIWALHPLQTESVTYVIQRVESLMGFFYFLTIYAFIRSCEEGARRTAWQVVAVVACWLGMGTKEVMVSAPLLVLLYDRTVITETFVGAWRKSRGFYGALFASWIFLGALLSSSFGHSQSTGFGGGISGWHYLLTQCRAIATYLGLSFWPAELTFDYGRPLVKNVWAVLPQAVFLTGLLGASLWAVVRRSLLGVAGVWFFATLAPSSSFVPVVTQTIAEHRMYLALAAVVVVVAVAAERLAGKWGMICLGLAVPALAVATYQRNELYREPLRLWADTVEKAPGSARGHSNYGYLLALDGKSELALPQFEAALANGDYIDAELYANYAYALNAQGRLAEAEACLQKALELNPHHHKVYAQKGNIAMKRGQMAEAVVLFKKSLAYAPRYVTARTNMAAAYVNLGELEKAAEQYAEALRIDENCSRAWTGMGVIAFRAGRLSEAEALCRRALAVASVTDEVEARSRLGEVLAAQQRPAEAEAEFVRALELRPRQTDLRKNLGSLLAQQGRYAEAIRHYEQVRSETKPDADLLGNLGLALELSGQTERAKACYVEVLQLNSRHPFARQRLDALLINANK